MRERLRRILAAVKSAVDLNDVFVFGGIAAAAYGIGQVHAPSAWIAAGVTFVWLGKFR